jgi:predicted RNase H-like HicB family nuclease
MHVCSLLIKILLSLHDMLLFIDYLLRKVIVIRQILLYPGEDGYWVAECASLPGCVSQGATKEEAIINICEAIQGYIAALDEDRMPIPEERFEALLVAV